MLATAVVGEMIGVAPADDSLASVETVPLPLGLGHAGGGMSVRARFKDRDARVGVALKKTDGTVCAQGEAGPTEDDLGAESDDVRSAAVRWSSQASGCFGEAHVSVHFELRSSCLFSFSFK